MEVIRIEGGVPLRGTVRVSGAKNACLPIFAATLLTEEPVTLDNVPSLRDIHFMGDILEHLGASVERGENQWKVEAKEVHSRAPYELVRKMRASVCLMGPLLGRLKHCHVSMPGGCVIGPRPIDLHLKGFRKLGCDVYNESGYVHLDATRARGRQIFLGGRFGSTVTGTANIVMAAVLTPGTTRIESAACEPEIVDLCEMLVKMGARIEGIGSHNLIIEGVDRLHGCHHRVISDRIEAGTFVVAAAMTGGDLTIESIPVSMLGALFDKLDSAGLPIDIINNDTVKVFGSRHEPKPVDLITMPYPGFPTDLQAQLCALCSLSPGISIITERIYPNRFMHVPELQRMGAEVEIEGPSAIVKGVKSLSGAPVMASDLRASAALVLAGMAARGETWVQRIYHLERGYQDMEKKLQAVGARIEKLPSDAMPKDLANEM